MAGMVSEQDKWQQQGAEQGEGPTGKIIPCRRRYEGSKKKRAAWVDFSVTFPPVKPYLRLAGAARALAKAEEEDCQDFPGWKEGSLVRPVSTWMKASRACAK
jgi:hypothetical protein